VFPEERPHNDKDCVNCGGCGRSNEATATTALNLVGAKLGDIVFIESDESKSMKLMAILLCSPILLPLGAFMLGTALNFPAIANGIMAGLGMFAAYRLIKYYNNKVANEPPFTKIVRIQEKQLYGRTTED
jgi:positive regulator of sigma E activity